MRKIYTLPNGKRIIIVSLFSGMDLFMFGMTKLTGMIPGYANERNFSAALLNRANYKHPDGTRVMEPFIEITEDEYKSRRASSEFKDTVGSIDGRYYRTRTIEEVNGQKIRADIEARYGKNIIIVAIGGPPCQNFTALSAKGRSAKSLPDDKNARQLTLEYLRIVKELMPDAAIMEQVTAFSHDRHNTVYSQFIEQLRQLPYRAAGQDLCSLHYGGNQLRWRYALIMVADHYNTDPAFPVPDVVNVKRVKDFLPHVKYFFSGHFTDNVKNGNDFMPVVTGGSPKYFADAQWKKWTPTIDELLLCFGVKKGEYIIPDGLSQQQIRKAIGNAVCIHVAGAIARTLINVVFKLRLDDDELFVPIDNDPDGPDVPLSTDGASGAVSNTSDEDTIDTDVLPTGEVNSVTDITQTHNTDQVSIISHEAVAIPDIPIQSNNDGIPNQDDVISGNVPLPEEPLRERIDPAPIPKHSPITGSVLPKFYESGFELWRGKSKLNGADIVAVLTLKSLNAKTGDMAQLWILTADRSPLEAIKTGSDDAICGSCKLRHSQDGACYVFVGQEPLNIWRAWRNGAYPKLPMKYYDQLAGLSIRFGAYGDPAAIPIDILTELKKYAKNYTGYTHQWRNETFAELKPLCMASVDNPMEYREATEKGWRTYRVKTAADPLLSGEVLCPHITSGVQCKTCHLCTGNSHKGRNIAIPVHGTRKGKFKAVSGTLSTGDAAAADNGTDEIVPSQEVHKPQIITSSDLVKMQFESLPFTAEWKELFGEPSINFHCVIHGVAGQGKSTFALEFSKYLSQTFGNTLYIAAEEGFERTLKDKVLNLHAESDTLHVANFRKYEDIMRIIQPGCYKFIFIDSLDRMKINAQKLNLIRHRFKDAALITISQATKAGQMRGSNELTHDSDIVIEVVDGVAVTTKNRFKEKGMRFDAFQYMKPSESKYGFLDKPPHFPKLRSSEPLSIQDQILALNDRLLKAVADEDYELAAQLRDKLDDLKKTK